MAEPLDLGPAGRELQHVVDHVRDDQLDRPTPCAGRTLGQPLQHVVGLTAAFRAAANKDLGAHTDTNPDADGWAPAEEGWRHLVAERLPAMVEAWREPEAWEGTTRAGGVELPGQVAGLVALDELVLHGWDIARATGQDYRIDDATAQVLLGFVAQFDAAGTPGLFGPALDVPADAPVFDQVLARAGRDPGWTPG